MHFLPTRADLVFVHDRSNDERLHLRVGMLEEVLHGRNIFCQRVLHEDAVHLTENGVLNFEVQALHVRNDVPGKSHRCRRLPLWWGRRGKVLIAESEHPTHQIPFDDGTTRLLLGQRPAEKRRFHRGVFARPIWSRMDRRRWRALFAHALLAEFLALQGFLFFEQFGPNDLIDLRLQDVFGQCQFLRSQFQIDPLLDGIWDDGN